MIYSLTNIDRYKINTMYTIWITVTYFFSMLDPNIRTNKGIKLRNSMGVVNYHIYSTK